MAEVPGQVDSAGVLLHYTARLGGSGTPVLLLHGLASSAAGTWQVSGWSLALTAAGLGWVAPDLRGHGRSDKPHDPACYRLPVLVDDVVAVLDHLALPVVDVLGYSLGARIALEFAGASPDRVRRLALGGLGDPRRPVATLTGVLDRLPPGADRDAVAACLAGASGADPAREGVSLDGPDGRDAFGRVRAPALLVAGDADEYATRMDALAGLLEAATTLRVPGRNHLTTVSARQFKRAVIGFLTGDETAIT